LEEFVVCGQSVMWRCPRCGLYQNGTLVDASEYEGSYHSIYERRAKQKRYTAAVRLNKVAAVLDNTVPRLIDVGCGLGCTVEAAALRGWEAVGVDVSHDAVRFCRNRGLDCLTTDGTTLPFDGGSFDVLTAWHVIEHVADVTETLAQWRRVLRPGGILALETPDASSPKVRARGAGYRRFWKPEHTYTFTPDNLSQFVERAGFELVPQPIWGRLRDLSPGMAGFAMGRQAWQGLRRALGIHKEFQIFARCLATAAPARRRPRIAA